MLTIKRLLSFLIILSFFNAGLAQSYISETIEYDGETREYEIYVPAVYDGSVEVPLIFSFHGGNGIISDQIAIGDFSSIADTANFIAVYPQALPDPNDGGSTNWVHKSPTEVDDVFFIDALIDAIDMDYQIDHDRIYACGYSNGGEMAYELGCRLNHRIASFAAVARTMGNYSFDVCAPVHPTGVLTILGTDDFISNYEGVFWAGIQYYLSADEMHNYWALQNNCNENSTSLNLPDLNTSDGSTVEQNIWSTTEGCAYVQELKVLSGGHDWPGSFGNMDFDATETIWEFVSRYDINGIIDCTTTSVDLMNQVQNNFRVYPNPAQDIVNIETELDQINSIKIDNSRGELVYQSMDPRNTMISISNLNNGLYTISILTNQGIGMKKLQIMK